MTEVSPHPPGPAADRRTDWSGLACAALLAGGTLGIYCRTFTVPLLLDDIGTIGNNPTIRHLWPLWPVLHPPAAVGVEGRPLLNLSFALNYAVGGRSLYGYHAVNLLIHVLAAWTLFALVRRTLQLPVLAQRFASAATPLALAVAAIWAWHPVQTESVTYLAQRAEALMGLCYLLTLYGFVRGAEADGRRSRRTWFLLSVLACGAGAAVKEVIVTAPLMVLLYDRSFLSGSWAAAWRRHRHLYLALAATWGFLGGLMIFSPHTGLGFDQGVAWWAYGLTECRVIVKYLLLALWPHPLLFDYGWYQAPRLSEIWPYVVALAGLLAATAFAWGRWPAAGFTACWFFLILAPTSSVIPIGGQPMAENRLYLPLAGVAALAVLGAYAWSKRGTLPVAAAVAVILAVLAVERNRDYASEVVLWQDTVAKNPSDARAHSNLGDAWFKIPGRLGDAVGEYQATVRLTPDSAKAHYNLGNAWLRIPERLDAAIAEYKEALRLSPNFAAAHYNLAGALARKPEGDEEAKAHLAEIPRLALQPNNDAARQILAKMQATQP